MKNLLAALTLCTRLPLWRWVAIPREAYERVTDYWPFVGWVTGGTMAAVLALATWIGFPPAVAVLMAIAVRVWLTGALHEDGLADFADGFGGGTSRERTLAIMKDSHIGTYGVITLILYFALLYAAQLSTLNFELSTFNFPLGALRRFACEELSIVLFCDVLAKVAASFVTGQLPYARAEADAKVKVVYRHRSWRAMAGHVVRCTLALALPVVLCVITGVPTVAVGGLRLPVVLCLVPVPFAVELLMVSWMRRRIGGYTGDCCGALFLVCELSLYLALLLVMS